MRTPTVSFWFVPIALLLVAGLLSTTACGRYSAHRSHHESHAGGMYPKHDGDHDAMHASGHGRRGMHHDTHQGAAKFIDHVLKFQDGMSLTDDQVQQLRTLKTNYQKARVTMKADMKLARIDLHETMKDEQASLADIEAQLNTLHASKTKLYLASIKAKRDANALLSEEQQSRMKTIHERIRSHGGNMMHQDDKGPYRKHNEHGRP